MATVYPVMLHLQGQRCLVVGGGAVALRKVEGLLAEGACVDVVALHPMAPLRRLATERGVALHERGYHSGEACRYALVFAATDDRNVNRQVFEDASGAGIWVNVADDPALCTFHLPSRMRRGALQLAIASAGEAPFVVRRLRQLLEQRFGPEWCEWIEAAARFREAVRSRGLSRAEQEERFDTFFGATVDPQRLTARVPSEHEEQHLLASRRFPSYTPGAFPQRSGPPSKPPADPNRPVGFVSLVGAGPGDGMLLTLRGRQRLLGADAVVCDRLALTALPCDLPARVRIHGVGKEAGHHPVPQAEIGALLVRLALDGKRVVRLKGGDPYVFGRGGEEAAALVDAGIPFEVVPGVTAGVAVPAYAGIPLTHRREAVRVTLITAHEAIKSGGPQVRWNLLATDPHATLVGYMGVTSLPHVVEELLSAGIDPDTPAAIIQQGTTSAQRVATASIAGLPAAVKNAGIVPPALFVIGPTVRHAAKLDWFGQRSLRGQRLVMFAPQGMLGEQLEVSGAEVVCLPIPITAAAKLVLAALPLTGCVVRSADEVDLLDEERSTPTWGSQVVAWCLTAEAAERARRRGWGRIERIPDGADAAQIVDCLTADWRARPD